METLEFNEIISKFELQLKTNFEFELQEKSYLPYSFGSGIAAYRIKGNIYRLSYDGKDNIVELEKSENHQKYPNCNWKSLFYAKPNEFLEKANDEIKDSL